jgi:hypothetical protein
MESLGLHSRSIFAATSEINDYLGMYDLPRERKSVSPRRRFQ